MATSYSLFDALPFEQQLALVWEEGRFLARRWEEEDGVSLYLMDGGFFCEVYLELDNYTVLRVESFPNSSERLQDYAAYVRLGDLTR